jgi:hypothetical protein
MPAQQNDPRLHPAATAGPGDPLDLSTSAAGEEDPGASLDLVRGTAGRSDPPSDRMPKAPTGGQAPVAPGDQAPVGTPSTGENVCPACGGSGRLGASRCPDCEGTGVVIVGIGGA